MIALCAIPVHTPAVAIRNASDALHAGFDAAAFFAHDWRDALALDCALRFKILHPHSPAGAIFLACAACDACAAAFASGLDFAAGTESAGSGACLFWRSDAALALQQPAPQNQEAWLFGPAGGSPCAALAWPRQLCQNPGAPLGSPGARAALESLFGLTARKR